MIGMLESVAAIPKSIGIHSNRCFVPMCEYAPKEMLDDLARMFDLAKEDHRILIHPGTSISPNTGSFPPEQEYLYQQWVEEGKSAEISNDRKWFYDKLSEYRKNRIDMHKKQTIQQDPKEEITVCILIGNSDNKLSQRLWSLFIGDLRAAAGKHCSTVHFDGGSRFDSQYQNACIVANIFRSDLHGLEKELRDLRKTYIQDSIAIVKGSTVMV